MGAELKCRGSFDGSDGDGTALLETNEIRWRGAGLRVVVPFAEIRELEVRDGVLDIQFGDGHFLELELGDKAAKWFQKIKKPPGILDKMGVKPGMRVSVVGKLPETFLAELRGRTEDVSTGRPRAKSDLILFAVERPDELGKLKGLVEKMKQDGALWLIREKGGKGGVTEGKGMAAGKAAGLVDVKVASFSQTHTAEKFVIPVNKRTS